MIAAHRNVRTLGAREAQRRREEGFAAEVREREREREEKKRREEERTRVVSGQRWDFRVRDFALERSLGRDGGRSWGRDSAGAVGARYGVPRDDRKKGKVKIPTRLE